MCRGEQDSNIAICKPYREFGLSFSSKQQVHNLQQKLYHSRSILANTLSTVSVIGTHEDDIFRVCNLPVSMHDDFQRELRNLSSELRNYKQTTRKLLSLANNIRLMVRSIYLHVVSHVLTKLYSKYDDILKLYGQELMYHNGMKLTQIAQADSVETKVMVSLANQTSQDSRTMRIATVVAMFYLPANLVTVLPTSFSSS